jgi:hypothetical protein
MLEINQSDLVFAFPDVDEEAILRVHFCPTNSPTQRIGIEGNAGSPLRLAAEGPFVMYLQPNDARRDCKYRSLFRYPFALLVSVGGKNAITGVRFTTLERSPQNYFSSPPQGGIDGYFLESRVHPFRAVSAPLKQTRLEVRVFPLKRKAMDHFRWETGLIPGRSTSVSGYTTLHGGERQCEPIYEDVCGFGSWDRDHEERASIWIEGES